jgi:hypothetical protein
MFWFALSIVTVISPATGVNVAVSAFVVEEVEPGGERVFQFAPLLQLPVEVDVHAALAARAVSLPAAKQAMANAVMLRI